MTASLVIVAIALGLGFFALIRMYLSLSLRSFEHAKSALSSIEDSLNRLIDSEVSAPVARVAFGLSVSAGCGCYVRAIVMSLFLPNPLVLLLAGGSKSNSRLERDLNELDSLDAAQRKLFSDLLAAVVVYDSYRNPISGWIFRKTLNYTFQSQTSFTERKEAELTTISVLSRQRTGSLKEFRGASVA